MVRRPEQYRSSAHGEYCGGKGAKIVESYLVLKVLGGRKSYRRFVWYGMKDEHKEEYYEVPPRWPGGESTVKRGDSLFFVILSESEGSRPRFFGCASE